VYEKMRFPDASASKQSGISFSRKDLEEKRRKRLPK